MLGSQSKKQSYDVVRLVDDLLRTTSASGASDIHFEPTASEWLIRYRLDGVLHDRERLPAALGEQAVTRLKVLGGLLTYRNDIPQEGRIALPESAGTSVLEQRLAVFPTIHGQRAVVRLFYRDRDLQRLERLGFSDYVRQRLGELVQLNQGVVLLTGPAGSGKSTTLAALLRHILAESPGRSIIALEDPVERHIEGVTQIQINPHGQMTYPQALRSLLRQDPEVLMIGEIRDAQTAHIVIEAGLSGHLLLSTMHSGTPAAALLRLLEMGIEPYQITSSISAIVNQRLLRQLCAACKQKYESGRYCLPEGCTDCEQTGYHGRLLIAEMVESDGPIRQAILTRASAQDITEQIAKQGQMSMLHQARQKLHEGLTSPAELHKYGFDTE